MYIRRLVVENFRSFSESEKEYNFDLGEHITCIAGHNGVGKSTLLAILSNCGELKKEFGCHLNGRVFRGEYSQLIKGDVDHDTPGDKATFYFENNLPGDDFTEFPDRIIKFRSTFQKRGSGLRYRLIPKKTDEKPNEKKLEWPTYYLGLSRLYPVGESNIVHRNKMLLPKKMESMLSNQYKKILSIDEDIISTEKLTLSDAKRKTGSGIKTSKYGVLANSAGQDNLGQILLTLSSFAKLKEDLGKAYNGGILLIDEIDATLHPSAQYKLFDYLYEVSKNLKLQVVFTSHSISLIRYILDRRGYSEYNRSLSLIYLTNARGTLEIHNNPDKEFIEHDLTNSYRNSVSRSLINVITEDAVARLFLKKILEYAAADYYVNFLDLSISFSTIIELVKSGENYFKNYMIVLDPDTKKNNIKMQIESKLETSMFVFEKKPSAFQARILSLPGKKCVEEIVFEYLQKLQPNNDFYQDPEIARHGIVKRSFCDGALDRYNNEANQLRKIKCWFHDNMEICKILIDYWIKDNKKIVDKFINSFNIEYNRINNK